MSCGLYLNKVNINKFMGFPGGSDGKESASNVGDLGLIPGLGRSLGEGNGYPLQRSCLENPHRQRNLVSYSQWGRKESDTTEQLSLFKNTSTPTSVFLLGEFHKTGVRWATILPWWLRWLRIHLQCRRHKKSRFDP